MIIRLRDGAKLFGVCVIAFCAVYVCALFLNYHADLNALDAGQLPEQALLFFQAQVSTARAVCWLSGGCLLATSVVTLSFYIRHYIAAHRSQLGILKAMGYSAGRIAGHFWVFGLTTLIGTGIGFSGAWLTMPAFYRVQNQEHVLPEFLPQFHPELLLWLVILPAGLFALLAVGCAWRELRDETIRLLKGDSLEKRRGRPRASRGEETLPFLWQMRKNTLRSRKSLAFFILFAAFCFSSLIQMGLSMKDLASQMMGAIMLLIGIMLSLTTLLLAVPTVVQENAKSIAVMRAFGYSHGECCRALLGGYRPMGYLGFLLGTVYQYALLKLMVTVVFRDIAGVPAYGFRLPLMLGTLAVYLVLYECIMLVCANRIRKISVKEIMAE